MIRASSWRQQPGASTTHFHVLRSNFSHKAHVELHHSSGASWCNLLCGCRQQACGSSAHELCSQCKGGHQGYGGREAGAARQGGGHWLGVAALSKQGQGCTPQGALREGQVRSSYHSQLDSAAFALFKWHLCKQG